MGTRAALPRVPPWHTLRHIGWQLPPWDMWAASCGPAAPLSDPSRSCHAAQWQEAAAKQQCHHALHGAPAAVGLRSGHRVWRVVQGPGEPAGGKGEGAALAWVRPPFLRGCGRELRGLRGLPGPASARRARGPAVCWHQLAHRPGIRVQDPLSSLNAAAHVTYRISRVRVMGAGRWQPPPAHAHAHRAARTAADGGPSNGCPFPRTAPTRLLAPNKANRAGWEQTWLFSR